MAWEMITHGLSLGIQPLGMQCKWPERWLRMVCHWGYSHWACSVNGLRDDYAWSVSLGYSAVMTSCCFCNRSWLVHGLHWSHCLCGILKHWVPSAVLKLVYSIPSIHCRQWWDPGKLSFVGMQCFCNVQLTGDYRCLDMWFNQTPQVTMSHSESIS